MSLLLKYYLQKVLAKIKSPALQKKSGLTRNIRRGR